MSGNKPTLSEKLTYSRKNPDGSFTNLYMNVGAWLKEFSNGELRLNYMQPKVQSKDVSGSFTDVTDLSMNEKFVLASVGGALMTQILRRIADQAVHAGHGVARPAESLRQVVKSAYPVPASYDADDIPF